MSISQDPVKILEGDAYETRIVKCSRCGEVMPAAPFPKLNQPQDPVHRPRCGRCGSMMTFPVGVDNPGIGGGKYEKQCLRAKEECEAESLILVVFGGKHGNGFSVAAVPEICIKLPELLRSIADGMEVAMKKAAQS